MAKVFDDYQTHVAHVRTVQGFVYHAAVAGDAKSARCLENDIEVRGETREQCLELLGAKLDAHLAVHHPRGVTG